MRTNIWIEGQGDSSTPSPNFVLVRGGLGVGRREWGFSSQAQTQKKADSLTCLLMRMKSSGVLAQGGSSTLDTTAPSSCLPSSYRLLLVIISGRKKNSGISSCTSQASHIAVHFPPWTCWVSFILCAVASPKCTQSHMSENWLI